MDLHGETARAQPRDVEGVSAASTIRMINLSRSAGDRQADHVTRNPWRPRRRSPRPATRRPRLEAGRAVLETVASALNGPEARSRRGVDGWARLPKRGRKKTRSPTAGLTVRARSGWVGTGPPGATALWPQRCPVRRHCDGGESAVLLPLPVPR